MSLDHLTKQTTEEYIGHEMNRDAQARVEEHLATCAACRQRVELDLRMEDLLHRVERIEAPRDLAARISAAADLQRAQEQARRERLPLIAAATIFSLLVTLWFGLQLLVAFQEDGALDFFALATSHPEVYSAYTSDALFALFESLPFSEIVLTLFALVTVVVLTQQWAETIQPSLHLSRHGRG